jgi:hypothetical protein
MTTHVNDGRELLPTSADTVAIMAFPDGANPPRAGSQGEGILTKLRRIGRYKRNPRSADYMRHVAASMLPTATLIEVGQAVPADALSHARHIVLLWPDAIGYGWAPLEREVVRRKRPDAAVYALTGRRRAFRLTAGTLFGLRLRRLAERLWLGEAVMAIGLLVSAPFLVMWDFAQGHR